jgi:cell division protein FtsB
MFKKLKSIRDKKWFAILSNSYVLILTIFAIWMLFFDTNSLLIQRELNKQIDELEEQREYLLNELAKDSATVKVLSSDKAIEKFARERFYYQKKNEDVYLIEFKDSIQNKSDE